MKKNSSPARITAKPVPDGKNDISRMTPTTDNVTLQSRPTTTNEGKKPTSSSGSSRPDNKKPSSSSGKKSSEGGNDSSIKIDKSGKSKSSPKKKSEPGIVSEVRPASQQSIDNASVSSLDTGDEGTMEELDGEDIDDVEEDVAAGMSKSLKIYLLSHFFLPLFQW